MIALIVQDVAWQRGILTIKALGEAGLNWPMDTAADLWHWKDEAG